MPKLARLRLDSSLTLLAGTCLVSVAWMLACAPAVPQRAPLPPPTYRFSYEPPQQAPRTGIALALVRPSYQYQPLAAGANPPVWRQWQVVGQYLQSMGGDFQRMLVAKGFTITGPFDDLNLMTYPDKQTANLTLTPKVFLNLESQASTNENSPFFGSAAGTLTVSSWITFEILEPLSGEKMWIKKVDLEPVQEQYTYDYRVIREDLGGGRTSRRVERSNSTAQHVMARVLEGYYPKVMNVASTYFNAQEVLAIKKMADDIREKKRF